MSKIIQKIYTDKGIIALGILFYFMVSMVLQIPSNAINPTFIPNDSQSYTSAATNLFSGFQFDPIRPWGYPFIIGLCKLFGTFNEFNWFLWLLQFASWLGVLYMIFRICKLYTEQMFGFILVFIYLSFSSLIIFTWLTLTESIFTFLITYSLYKLVNYIKSGKVSALHLSFLAMCFSATLRPTTLYFSILAFLILIAFYKINKSKFIKNTLISFAILLLTIGTQIVAMKSQYGIGSPSIIGKMALYEYLGTHAMALKNNVALKQERESRKRNEDQFMSSISGNDYWKKRVQFYDDDFRSQLKDNKLNLAKAMVTNIRMNLTEHSAELSMLQSADSKSSFIYSRLFFYKLSRWQNIGMNLSLLLLCAITLVRFVSGVKKFLNQKTMVVIAVACSLCLYLLLISGFSFWQGDRFSVVYYPIILIGLALTLGYYKLTKKEKRILES